MVVLTEGHKYIAANFENADSGQTIQFIEKKSRAEFLGDPDCDEPNELITVNDGTTNEELIRVLLDRINYLNGKFPCRENALAITKLQEALFWLEERTRLRTAKRVEGKNIAH